MSAHWAIGLIGLPYARGEAGPLAFDCWGLVRWVFEHVHGVPLPVIAVDDDSANNAAAIRQAAEVSGWRPSDACQPAENDIVLMSGPDGRHIGVIVRANGGLFLLHCLEGPGVCLQPVPDLARSGFRDFTYWRRGS